MNDISNIHDPARWKAAEQERVRKERAINNAQNMQSDAERIKEEKDKHDLDKARRIFNGVSKDEPPVKQAAANVNQPVSPATPEAKPKSNSGKAIALLFVAAAVSIGVYATSQIEPDDPATFVHMLESMNSVMTTIGIIGGIVALGKVLTSIDWSSSDSDSPKTPNSKTLFTKNGLEWGTETSPGSGIYKTSMGEIFKDNHGAGKDTPYP